MKMISLTGRGFISLILCIVVLYGCTSPENNTYMPSPVVNESPASIPQSEISGKKEQAVPHSFTVEIKKMKFFPEEITVQKGDTVIWINHDLVTHCITEEKTKAWTSSEMQAGVSWKKVIKKSSNYYCAIHQVMKGRVLVQ